MDGKMFGLLLIGLYISSTLVAGHNGTDHSHSGQAECNMTAVHTCLSPFVGSGQLVKFDNFEEKSEKEQDKIMQDYNKTTILDVCSGFRAVGDCLRAEEGNCVNLNDTSEDMYKHAHELCSERTDCLYDMWECMRPHSELLESLEGYTGMLNETHCQPLNETTHCMRRRVPIQCRLVPEVKKALDDLMLGDSMCYSSTCSGVKACLDQFETAQPANPMDARTCFLYANYTGCVGQALAGCLNIRLPEGQTPLSKIKELVTDSCNEVQQVSGLFGCSAFSECVNVSSDTTFIFVPKFCPSFQDVTHCAAMSVYNATCSVNASTAQAFATKANALAQKGAGFGCGRPQINAKECTGLQTCFLQAEDIYGEDFHQVCSGIANFTSCADTAIETCGLRPTPPEGATVRFPRLSVLSSITSKLCSAMQNATLTNCSNFNSCLGGNKQPEELWQMVDGQAWCLYTIQTLECSRSFSDDCQTPEDLKNTLAQIYEDYLNAGCQNVYGYVFRPTTAPPDPNETDPTQGAQSLVGLSLAWMLLLSLLHLL